MDTERADMRNGRALKVGRPIAVRQLEVRRDEDGFSVAVFDEIGVTQNISVWRRSRAIAIRRAKELAIERGDLLECDGVIWQVTEVGT